MKRFWVVLLAAALVAGFAVSASAMDVKFNGSYYVLGAHADNWGLADDDETDYASYGQRLRLGTEFKIAEGLTLNTRFDALEGRWGQFGTYGQETSRHNGEDDDNISFDRAWITFVDPFGGKFDVGRMNGSSWGTIFGDNHFDADRIKYTRNYGPLEVGGTIEKTREEWGNGDAAGPEADSDYDKYELSTKYKWNGGIAGLKVAYNNDASGSDQSNAYKAKYWEFQPYAQATFGPVFVEAEVNYRLGKYREYEDGVDLDDRDYKAWNAYVHAKADIQNFYVGGLYGFVSGQDPEENGSGDDYTVGPSGGRSWNPTLILWNEYTNKWAGQLGYQNARYGTTDGQAMSNAHLFQIYAGVKPAQKWDIKASVSYAFADEDSGQDPTRNAANNGYASNNYVSYEDDEYGTEIDLTASYKIYDNLTYTVGLGYLWAGDYFKGLEGSEADVDDTYLVMHRLDLVF